MKDTGELFPLCCRQSRCGWMAGPWGLQTKEFIVSVALSLLFHLPQQGGVTVVT